jgi:hypothetical protein
MARLLSSPVHLTDSISLTIPISLGRTSAFRLCTVTIATPGGVHDGNTFAANDPVVLSTTGALPTGLVAGTTYYVSATSLSGSFLQAVGNSGRRGHQYDRLAIRRPFDYLDLLGADRPRNGSSRKPAIWCLRPRPTSCFRCSIYRLPVPLRWRWVRLRRRPTSASSAGFSFSVAFSRSPIASSGRG